jgi:hypothetical protein
LAKHEPIRILTGDHGVSVKRACQEAPLSRAALYRREKAVRESDQEVTEVLKAIVAAKMRRGLIWK